MLNDDSFNDSDEIFNLYSSKKVTEIFKAQFEELNSDDSCSPSDLEKSDNFCNGNKPKENECFSINENSPDVGKNISDLDEPICLTEDSIEIIDSNPTERVTRRSLRNRNKRVNYTNQPGRSDGDCSVAPTRKRAKRGRKKKQVDEIIQLDSPKSNASNTSINDEDELNPEVSVKVIWKSVNIKKFNIRKFQKFSKVFDELSIEENIPKDKIVLTFNNVKVSPNDTPDSLNLHVYHFLDGGELNEVINSICDSAQTESQDTENCLTLKFQDRNKKIVKITLGKNEKMKLGMIKYSEQMEIPLEKIKFFFDGELLSSTDTPESLGMENDELIDIKISN